MPSLHAADRCTCNSPRGRIEAVGGAQQEVQRSILGCVLSAQRLSQRRAWTGMEMLPSDPSAESPFVGLHGRQTHAPHHQSRPRDMAHLDRCCCHSWRRPLPLAFGTAAPCITAGIDVLCQSLDAVLAQASRCWTRSGQTTSSHRPEVARISAEVVHSRLGDGRGAAALCCEDAPCVRLHSRHIHVCTLPVHALQL